MGLSTNISRRGGVYWWRGRIGHEPKLSQVIARSLRTRDPEVARVLGTQVTGLAVQLRQCVRAGTMTVGEAKGEINAFLEKFPFAFDPAILER